MELVEPTEENFNNLCNNLCKKIRDMLDDSEEFKEIIDFDLVTKMFDLVKKQEITKDDIIDSNCYIESFLTLVLDIYQSDNQALIFIIDKINVYEWALNLYNDKMIGTTDEHSAGYANRESVMLIFYILAKYDAKYVDLLLKHHCINKIMETLKLYGTDGINKEYGSFRSLAQDISFLTVKNDILKQICKKFIDMELIENLERIYDIIDDEDISTKFYISCTMINLIDNGFTDQRIIKFLLHILHMDEAGSVRDSDDRHNYSSYILSVCEVMCKLLTTQMLNDSEKQNLLKEIRNDYIVCNSLKEIVDDSDDEYDKDDAEELLELITNNKQETIAND